MDEEKRKNAKYNRKKGGISIVAVDPIYDAMSKNEIDEASNRFSSLLEEDKENDSNTKEKPQK